MLKELDSDNWAEVFGEGTGENTAILPQITPGDTIPDGTFSREDVAIIKGQVNGRNDEADWIVWGQLKDGRWFMAHGGCDYTGWKCQAHNDGSVASTEADLIRFGMTDDERDRFGLVIS